MAKYQNMSLQEFAEAIQSDDNAVVLDVRTGSEYASGHLEMALNIPDVKSEIENLDKSKHYYVHCRVGGRSAVASQILVMNGFEHVYNLNASIEDISLPLVKEAKPPKK